ncbi:MAG: FAD-dependent oxidoreductase [Lachnospirales bacterium]
MFVANLYFKELVKFGAPNEIMYEAKPHIGTDKLINIVRNIREEIISLGGEIHFNSRVSSINVENGVLKSVEVNNKNYDADNVILAIGDSAVIHLRSFIKKV